MDHPCGIHGPFPDLGDEAFNRARDASSKAVHDVEHKIEERPFLSVVLMFLAGLLVGRLLDR